MEQDETISFDRLLLSRGGVEDFSLPRTDKSVRFSLSQHFYSYDGIWVTSPQLDH